jgi:poly(A) polymerase
VTPVVPDEGPERFSALLAFVAPLATPFAAAGFSLYLVGGIVRDQLLGREFGPDVDLDLTTDAPPAQIKRLVADLADAVWTQGERFGTIGARIAGRDFEITTHRAEAYTNESRKPVVRFSDRVTDDLARRDFTVNAMALEVLTGALVDPFDGRGDLTNAILRTPLDPDESFSDDPLRMLRAARFRAGYGLVPVPELVESMRRTASRLAIVSIERIRAELDKLLCVADPTVGFELLVETGVIDRFLPELRDPHGATVALAAVANVVPKRLVRAAALLHGLDPEALRARVATLRYANDEQRRIVAMASGWRRLASSNDPHAITDGSVRRFVAALGRDTTDAIAVARAVAAAGGPLARPVVDGFTNRLASLVDVEDLYDLRPSLGGAAIMAILGVGAGPEVGQASRFLLDLRLDVGPLARAEAENRLRLWWAGRADDAAR